MAQYVQAYIFCSTGLRRECILSGVCMGVGELESNPILAFGVRIYFALTLVSRMATACDILFTCRQHDLSRSPLRLDRHCLTAYLSLP